MVDLVKMIHLPLSLAEWSSQDFNKVLKHELEDLGTQGLPLCNGTSQGGYVSDDPISVTVNRFTETQSALVGSVGVFFTEIVINCGCGVDPMPINAYCELSISINKNSALTEITVLSE